MGGAYGPVCAIGKPGEPSPPFGAARQYLDDASWQGAVEQLAREAQAIVVVVDETSGVQWELERIAQLGLRGKTFHLISPLLDKSERMSALRALPDAGALTEFGLETVGYTFEADGDARVYAAPRSGRDAVRVALTRFLLETLGYPQSAVAKPTLDVVAPPQVAKKRRRRPALSLAGIAILAFVAIAGATAHQWSPQWRAWGRTILADLQEAETARRAALAAAEPASAPQPSPARAHGEARSLDCDNPALDQLSFICSGREHMRGRRYPEAAAAFSEAIRIAPNDSDALLGRGEAFINQGAHSLASVDIQRVLALEPNNARAHYFSGRIADASAANDAAIAAYSEALRLDPEMLAGYLSRALALIEAGRHDEALNDANVAVRLDPQSSYWARGIVHFRRREFDLAKSNLEAAIAADPDDHIAIVWLGNVLHAEGDYRAAAAEYRRAISIRPNAGYLENLGGSLRLGGEADAAREAYQRAIALSPDRPDSLYWLGEMDRAVGHNDEALDNFERALAINARHFSARLGAARSLRALRRYSESIGRYSGLLADHPERGDLWRERGHVHYEASEFPASVSDYTEAARLMPDNASVILDRAWAHNYLGNFSAAAADAERALSTDPNSVHAHLVLGNARLNTHAYSDAVSSFDRVLSLENDNVDALASRGITRLRLHDFTGAIRDVDRALVLQPGHVTAVVGKCAVSALIEPAAAQGACDEAVRRAPGAVSLSYRALAYYHNSQWDEALRDIDASIEQDGSPGSRYFRGVVLVKLGRDEEGRADIEAGMAANPAAVGRLQTIWGVTADGED